MGNPGVMSCFFLLCSGSPTLAHVMMSIMDMMTGRGAYYLSHFCPAFIKILSFLLKEFCFNLP
jgi:hypothetical protein